jgi:hypothetical protein
LALITIHLDYGVWEVREDGVLDGYEGADEPKRATNLQHLGEEICLLPTWIHTKININSLYPPYFFTNKINYNTHDEALGLTTGR